MTKRGSVVLAAAITVGAPLALGGCERETQTEIEPDGDIDREVEYGIDEEALDEAEEDLDRLADEASEGARQIGEQIDEGAAVAGETLREAAQNASDVIDENVDLGANAGTPEVDDDN